jgi:alkanesulfonate monooxygenase SsuD/methylene tetrahydromethanopterin reductase-like flavin-dependent oxidoreductase (luciferase family)
VRWGAHLPLADFGDGCGSARDLRDYARAARELGYDTVSANDHLVWQRPWLDGPSALAAVAGCAPGLTLATTVALPTVRHPVVLAKALSSLAVLHGGPVVAGIGPGSSRADHDAVGVPFDERWARFDEAAGVLRRSLHGDDPRMAPMPERPPQVWFGSWGGSGPRLRATAALADGWLASGYNTTPQRFRETRARLDAELARAGRDPAAFPDAIATTWLYVTEDPHELAAVVGGILAPALRRDPRTLAEHLPLGSPEHCVRVLTAYADAGARQMLLWPVRGGVRQLEAFARHVAPHVT